MSKQRINTKLAFGLDITEPLDSIHMGEGKRIRLEDVPEEGETGDKQVGNRAYSDNRYKNLSTTILTNQNIGGISAGDQYDVGTPIETILRDILVSYIQPSFNTLRLRNGDSVLSTSVREIGADLIATTVSVVTVVDNPNGNVPTEVTISVSGALNNNGVIGQSLTPIQGSGILEITDANYSRNTNGSVTFSIQGLDENGNQVSSSTSYVFQSYNYFGGSSVLITNDSSALSVREVIKNQKKQIGTTKAWNTTGTVETNNPSNYSYIIYPASYGDLVNVLLGAVPVLGAFTKVGDFNIPTENGNVTVSYRVYKSNATGAFYDGTPLTIQ